MSVQSAPDGHESDPVTGYQDARNQLELRGRVQLEAAARVAEAESLLDARPADRRARSRLKAARKDFATAMEQTVEAAVKLTRASQEAAGLEECAPGEH